MTNEQIFAAQALAGTHSSPTLKRARRTLRHTRLNPGRGVLKLARWRYIVMTRHDPVVHTLDT